MRCTVIGAGAWGLPAAAELARRGHEVTVVDRYGVGNDRSSSRGPTRLWRLADPDPVRVRLSRRGLAGRAGVYGMPTPGRGYKMGLDAPLRPLAAGDDDRTPDAPRTAQLGERMRALFPGSDPAVVDEQVCTWTDSPDGDFVIDRIGDGVVLACGDSGDSGEGFKYSALMGEVLADLAEGRPADADVARCGLARLRGLPAPSAPVPTALGRVD